MNAAQRNQAVEAATGLSLDEWRSYPWWPNDQPTSVSAGHAGHDHEITATIDCYGYNVPVGQEPEFIPEPVAQAVAALLPEWAVDNRGSRLEFHPTGRRYQGFVSEDVDKAKAALTAVGLIIE